MTQSASAEEVTGMPARRGAVDDRADGVEMVTAEGVLLACIVRAAHDPARTHFVTPPELPQQLGFIVYPAGSSIPRHAHRPIRRELVGTPEVLVVRRGSCTVEVFDGRRRRVAARDLHEGDVILLLAGGHGFHMLEDTVLLEVKQGPYTGLDEKEAF